PAATVATAMLGGGGDAGNLAVAGSRPTDLSPVVVRLQCVLEMLPTAIMVLDVMDTVLVWNTAAESLFDISGDHAVGAKFRDIDISYRVEGLRARIEEVKSAHIPSRIEHATFTRRSGETVHAELTIVPMVEGNRVTAVGVYGSDTTESARLKDQTTRLAEQHSTAIEELQSTNEELETTNEELQSTNEELETTNEELQSTNEELETTVEELQAANAELGSLNTQLERRGVELKNLDEYQQSVLSSLQHAIVVLDRHGLVTTWNQTAERLWGLPVEHVVRRLFWTLPVGDIAPKLREALTRMLDSGSREAETLHDVPFRLPTGETRHLTVQVTPLESTSGQSKIKEERVGEAELGFPYPRAAIHRGRDHIAFQLESGPEHFAGVTVVFDDQDLAKGPGRRGRRRCGRHVLRRPRQREPDDEGAAVAQSLAVGGDRAAVKLDQAPDQREAEAEPAARAIER